MGLLFCESHDGPVVECAFKDIQKPIGVSTYLVTRELPAPVRDELPTVEDLEMMVTKLNDEMEQLRHQRKGKR